MSEAWKSGLMSHRIGEYFVMPRRTANGALVYGAWCVRTRARNGEGTCELFAEFRSKQLAWRWCRERNKETP